MNLRESFQYMNFLDRTINQGKSELTYASEFAMKTKEYHYRSQSIKDVEDTEKEGMCDKNYEPNDVIEVLMALLNEKDKVGKAIYETKANAEMEIDHVVNMNKSRQSLARTFGELAKLKAKEAEGTGQDYMINNEGNQTPYRYPIKKVTTINFDRNKVKKLQKALLRDSDEASTTIDRIMINAEVNVDTAFDETDSFEDIMENYIANKTK